MKRAWYVIFGMDSHMGHMIIYAKNISTGFCIGHMNYKVKIIVKVDTLVDPGVTFIMDSHITHMSN